MSTALKDSANETKKDYKTLEVAEEGGEAGAAGRSLKSDQYLEVLIPEFTNPHKNLGDGGFRAAILGFSDGMVSNLLLILGVQFAFEEADGEVATSIVTTGFSGLVASAFSMGIGEWISMKNEGEALKAEVITETQHLDKYWDQEMTEFLHILEGHGISKETLNMVEADLKDAPKEKVVDFHLKLELGIDAEDVGNPLKAAGFSGLFVAIGSFIPVLPYTFLEHDIAWIVALVLAAIFGTLLGVATGKIAGISIIKPAVRQLLGIAVAAGIALLVNYYLVSMVHEPTNE
mmetsp:Transcript_24767/g.39330  ORF Transcript_24767/g.39330 Transcript_24767/m.39330 type:complete len:289 (-) Transcript_24767:19-885(-)